MNASNFVKLFLTQQNESKLVRIENGSPRDLCYWRKGGLSLRLKEGQLISCGEDRSKRKDGEMDLPAPCCDDIGMAERRNLWTDALVKDPEGVIFAQYQQLPIFDGYSTGLSFS